MLKLLFQSYMKHLDKASNGQTELNILIPTNSTACRAKFILIELV